MYFFVLQEKVFSIEGKSLDRERLAFIYSQTLPEVLEKLGRVAQLGEHRPYKPGVTGSSPVPPTI